MNGSRKGFTKQAPWRDSPDTLRKVAQACELSAQRLRTGEIAQAIGVSERTARLYLQRGRELYRAQAARDSETLVDNACLVFDGVQRDAWRRLAAIPPGEQGAAAAALLGRVESAEWRRSLLLGVARTEAAGEPISEIDLRARVRAMAIQMGMTSADFPAPGPSHEAEYFDPDGDSGIDFPALPR